MGKPVLSTDTDGAHSIFSQIQKQMLIKQDDEKRIAKEFASKLNLLIEHPNKKNALVRDGKQIVKNHTLARAVQDMKNILLTQ